MGIKGSSFNDTYWSVQVVFVRLEGSPKWEMMVRTFDGQDDRTVTRTHGLGALTEQVLCEQTEVMAAIIDSIAERVEGVQQDLAAR